jgi:dihydropteroate synthase
MPSRGFNIALMGILNLTPDSFFDGGAIDLGSAAAKVARVEKLVRDGANVVDIGAESTRPGASPIDAAEQIARIGSTIREARSIARISIDTTDPAVARWALDEGATMLNSVSLDAAAPLGALANEYRAELLLMHSRGSMRAMPGFSTYPRTAYDDVVEDVAREWSVAADRATAEGLERGALWFDPGIGFHKNASQSLELLGRLSEFRRLGVRVCVGTSRKSFIAAFDRATQARSEKVAPCDRLGGSIATALAAAARGATLLRVHDVADVRQALDLFFAVEARSARPSPPEVAAR